MGTFGRIEIEVPRARQNHGVEQPGVAGLSAPHAGRRCVAAGTAARTSMPRQRLRSIPSESDLLRIGINGACQQSDALDRDRRQMGASTSLSAEEYRRDAAGARGVKIGHVGDGVHDTQDRRLARRCQALARVPRDSVPAIDGLTLQPVKCRGTRSDPHEKSAAFPARPESGLRNRTRNGYARTGLSATVGATSNTRLGAPHEAACP
jgi:hypothetical protein